MAPNYLNGLVTLVPISRGYRTYFLETDSTGIVGNNSLVLCDENGTPIKFTVRTRKDVEKTRLQDELKKLFNCDDTVPSAITGEELTLINPEVADKTVSNKTDEEHENLMYSIYESYTAEDIGEIDGEENIVFWHPNIDGTRIESCVNLDIQYPYFRYIRSKADDEYGKICRIRLDKPEYIIHKGDTILTKIERDKLIQILNSKHFWPPLPNSQSVWKCLLDSNKYGYQWYNKSTIDLDYKMPDYSLLPTSD